MGGCGDLGSSASLGTELTLRVGRRAACSGASRAVDGEREDSAGRKDLPRPSLPAGRRLVLRLVVGQVLHRGSGIASRGRRGRGSLEVSTRTRLRGKWKRGGNLEPSPPPLSSSTCLRTSRQG